MMLLSKRHDTTLAIDFGADAVRIVEVRGRRDAAVLAGVAEQTLPEGAEQTLPERHLEALADLLRLHRVKARRAVAALPASLVVTRTVNLNKAREQQPAEYIRWTLQNCLTYDVSDAVFDYWPTRADAEPGRGEVIVVAAQTSVVQRYLRGMEKLRLTCCHLDSAPCAIATLIARSIDNPEATVGTLALADRLAFFGIVANGRVVFWRPFELPQKQSDPDARAQNTERIGDEISKCVSHMVGTMHLDNLGELLLFGHGAHELADAGLLQHRFNLDMRAPSPFDALPADRRPPGLDDAGDATHYCAAVGLALQNAAGGAPWLN